jgi:hypothetical protein
MSAAAASSVQAAIEAVTPAMAHAWNRVSKFATVQATLLVPGIADSVRDKASAEEFQLISKAITELGQRHCLMTRERVPKKDAINFLRALERLVNRTVFDTF